MATRKVKRYNTGDVIGEPVGDSNEGMKEAYDARIAAENAQAAKNSRDAAEKEGLNISEGERVSNMPASVKSAPQVTAKPKANVVTKEELAKSGLSLRDYMNKQQGLTRRGDSSPRSTGDEAARLENRYKKPPLRQVTQKELAESYNRKRGIPGFKAGGSVSSASKRADGIAIRGKTRA